MKGGSKNSVSTSNGCVLSLGAIRQKVINTCHCSALFAALIPFQTN